MALVGGIEAGGTKFVCALGTAPEALAERIEFSTTTPEETIDHAVEFLQRKAERFGRLAAVGIASFGPIDLDRSSPGFGHITSTPKPGWRNVDLAGAVRRALNVPVAFDTDVNAAALGERRWGAGQGLDTLVYLTVGTGIGGGGMAGGKLMHGALHPEMGHMRIPHDWQKDPFPGSCPFHGDCWEGLASGTAIQARWGTRGENLPPDHAAWLLEARYLALGVANLICALSPERIIVGGGVTQQARLLPLIRQSTLELLNGYIRVSRILDHIEEYLVPARLKADAGVLGAIALALDAAAGV